MTVKELIEKLQELINIYSVDPDEVVEIEVPTPDETILDEVTEVTRREKHGRRTVVLSS